MAFQASGLTFTVFSYLIESLPRKSSFSWLSGRSFTCSTLKEQQPTVSASYSLSFSLPARRARVSMR
jgi:hypothetical protein